ncbi:RNA ligase [Catovirus CTV1]|uniref:RNA ligase n=1 Tax=Catovirus CTV1 TaxID=1977631 RepID=A0A1V0SC36_9VIRU|nr:RNA ligase [Catovirus CTV1]
MNVTKYICPTEEYVYNNSENGRSAFPSYVPKTDEDRIQNIPAKLAKLKNRNIIITKKFDGTSATYIYNNNQFIICSRNNAIVNVGEKHTLHFFEIEKKYDLGDKMKKLGKNIAIQGEICGPKIGGNRLKLNHNDLFVFNIYDIDTRKYLLWNDLLAVTKELNLKTVDVIHNGLPKEEWSTIGSLLELADSQTYNCGNICEGIVVKTDDDCGRTSFKVISNKYLLKYNL